ncbi:sulfotransferase family 1A member 1 S homeolog [Xenopus laevis]|nr:sulfotransferase family 1A member 1 S homeolog [Xenopus laevis]AAH80096.1 MGC84291 protein [Xenopus laevis]
MPILGPFAENWENVEKFQARPDDLLICTYPKSGTTWICEIVDQILAVNNAEGCKNAAIFERVPFLEYAVPNMISGTAALDQRASPRIIKTHLPVELLPKSFWDNKVKIIYVARNAKDVAVSYYHFYQMAIVHPEPGTWDEFLDSYIEGKVCFGPWSTHVKGWWQMAKKWDVLYLFYEDMLEDLTREIRKVVKFMGKDLSKELVEKIASLTSFKAMKENKNSNYTTVPSSVMDHSISPFMRKGVCGDWKNQFSVAQNEKFDKYYQREMADCDLSFRS